MDENNDEITDSTDGHLAGVRAGAMRLQQIQRDINMNLVDARLHAGSTNVLDQARAVQIERTLQSLRNERALVEQGNLGPDYRSRSAWGSGGLMEAAVSSSSSHGGLFGAAASSSSASSTPPILPAGATSGGGLFMGTAASTPAGSVGTITGATPGNAAASTPGLFGAAAGIDWNWRPPWLQTARPAQPIAGIDFATDLNWRRPRVMPSDSTTDPVEEVD